ncbi:MAG: sigma-70 family RNA polymerase sigma factor [Gammaproteobacteria bacterium]
MEQRLIEQAQSGSRPALNRLLQRCYPGLLNLAKRMLRHDHDAQDAAQEAALRVVQHLEQLDDAAAFSSWSRMILRRCCLRVVERRYADQSRSVCFRDDCLESSGRSDGGKQIEDGIHIEEIFDRLEGRTAEILWLRLLLGLSVRETAESLGVSETVIKVRLHRARRAASSFA